MFFPPFLTNSKFLMYTFPFPYLEGDEKKPFSALALFLIYDKTVSPEMHCSCNSLLPNCSVYGRVAFFCCRLHHL